VILFRWVQGPEVFGAIYDSTDYSVDVRHCRHRLPRRRHRQQRPPRPLGHGFMVEVDWADGLVPDSNLIRWVGAPAEITR
jgi:hypothetical protein